MNAAEEWLRAHGIEPDARRGPPAGYGNASREPTRSIELTDHPPAPHQDGVDAGLAIPTLPGMEPDAPTHLWESDDGATMPLIIPIVDSGTMPVLTPTSDSGTNPVPIPQVDANPLPASATQVDIEDEDITSVETERLKTVPPMDVTHLPTRRLGK